MTGSRDIRSRWRRRSGKVRDPSFLLLRLDVAYRLGRRSRYSRYFYDDPGDVNLGFRTRTTDSTSYKRLQDLFSRLPRPEESCQVRYSPGIETPPVFVCPRPKTGGSGRDRQWLPVAFVASPDWLVSETLSSFYAIVLRALSHRFLTPRSATWTWHARGVRSRWRVDRWIISCTLYAIWTFKHFVGKPHLCSECRDQGRFVNCAEFQCLKFIARIFTTLLFR